MVAIAADIRPVGSARAPERKGRLTPAGPQAIASLRLLRDMV